MKAYHLGYLIWQITHIYKSPCSRKKLSGMSVYKKQKNPKGHIKSNKKCKQRLVLFRVKGVNFVEDFK